jgi:GMP synthase (glutamine-hydrolysing)
VQTADDGGPGLVATIARLHGIPVRVHRTDRGDALPAARELGALVVLGGPASMSWLIADAIDRGVPVLAIGPGAYMLAGTLGAAVYPGAPERACVAPIYLTDDGMVDRVVGAAPSPAHLLHRPRGRYQLPAEAVVLATCPVDQAPAFRFRRAYGVPFHIEVDAQLAARWRPEGCPQGFPTTAGLRASVHVLDAFARLALGRRAGVSAGARQRS